MPHGSDPRKGKKTKKKKKKESVPELHLWTNGSVAYSAVARELDQTDGESVTTVMLGSNLT